MKILVTYAVQGEFTELKFPGLIEEEEVHIGYIRTGVGKVKSAYYVSEVLNQAKPDLVINVGTAGSIDCQVGDILVCRHFIDRDMQKLADMGLEYEIDSSALLAEKGYCTHWAGEGICASLCLPCQERAFYCCEVCDGYHRTELREALGG